MQNTHTHTMRRYTISLMSVVKSYNRERRPIALRYLTARGGASYQGVEPDIMGVGTKVGWGLLGVRNGWG